MPLRPQLGDVVVFPSRGGRLHAQLGARRAFCPNTAGLSASGPLDFPILAFARVTTVDQLSQNNAGRRLLRWPPQGQRALGASQTTPQKGKQEPQGKSRPVAFLAARFPALMGGGESSMSGSRGRPPRGGSGAVRTSPLPRATPSAWNALCISEGGVCRQAGRRLARSGEVMQRAPPPCGLTVAQCFRAATGHRSA